MQAQALPSYALPLFGTFSVASVVGLVVLLLKFREDVSKALVDTVMNSEKFRNLIDALATKTHVRSDYVSKETYRDHHNRLKHLEASCPNCLPLKETKGYRMEDI